MAITYGYFNSIDGDRTYSADQMSEYFDGLVSNGVYESVGDGLQVLAGAGMTVSVQTGRAIVNCKWLKNDAPLTVNINPAHAVLNRYTAIKVRLNYSDRLIQIVYHDGVEAATPTKPENIRDSNFYDITLAYVYVRAGATSITQADITDARPSEACGWVTGLVNQVDTSDLYLQYQVAYENMMIQMQNWLTAQQEEFNSWFNSLTKQLNINTFVAHYDKYVVFEAGTSSAIVLDMQNYEYNNKDIIYVYINGLLGHEGTDYTLTVSDNVATVTVNVSGAGNVVDIRVLKSMIGGESANTGGGENEAIDIMSFGAPSISVGASTETTLDPHFTALEEVLG